MSPRWLIGARRRSRADPTGRVDGGAMSEMMGGTGFERLGASGALIFFQPPCPQSMTSQLTLESACTAYSQHECTVPVLPACAMEGGMPCRRGLRGLLAHASPPLSGWISSPPRCTYRALLVRSYTGAVDEPLASMHPDGCIHLSPDRCCCLAAPHARNRRVCPPVLLPPDTYIRGGRVCKRQQLSTSSLCRPGGVRGGWR